MEKQVYLQSIGNILLVKSNRAKRMVIRIKENEGVKVTVPFLMSFKSAEEFVFEKYNWIKAHMDKLKKLETQPSVFSEDIDFRTYYHTLHIIRENVKLPTAHVHKGKIQIYYPHQRNINDADIQNFIKKVILFTLRKEAEYYLPLRVHELADKYQLKINNIFLKNIKTRWGSCSAANNINLNIHLMRLPQRLIDYVILHELCHTIHKNHGQDFWSLLNKLTDNHAKKLSKEMKNYRISVF